MFDFDDLDIQGGSGKQTNGNGRKSRGNRSRGFSSLSNSSCNTLGGETVKLRRPSSRQQQQVELSGLRWSCGSCSKLGPRTSNEDRLVAIPNIYEAVAAAKCKAGLVDTSISGALNSHYLNSNSSSSNHAATSGNVMATGIGVPIPIENEQTQRQTERQGYFAVYDGHCGAQAAMHLQETLHLSIFNHPLYHTDLQTAIIESCVSTDRSFLAESRERKQYSGTTALGAIIRGSELVVFNIGDCHAVLSCNGVAIDMSDPHKPNRCVTGASLYKNVSLTELRYLMSCQERNLISSCLTLVLIPHCTLSLSYLCFPLLP
jgi:Protein phosphatase 2C